MATVTRGSFLKKTSASAIAIGALAAVPGMASAATRADAAPLTDAESAEPFMVYVRNARAGEIVFLVGTQEFTRTDPELAARLWRAREGGRSTSANAKVR